MFFNRPPSKSDKQTPIESQPAPSGPVAEARKLPTAALRPGVNPADLGFQSTGDLEPASGLIGQERALKAVELGANIRQRDFNLFVMGPAASGKSTAVKSYLARKAADEPVPPSWVYVNNFTDPSKPIAISLPGGRCSKLADGMIAVIDELRTSVPAMFESDDYRSRQRAIQEEYRNRQEGAFEALRDKAQEQGIAVMQTQTGIGMAPIKDGQVLPPEEFQTLPEPARKEIEGKIEALQGELGKIIEQIPRLQKEQLAKTQALNEHFAHIVVSQTMEDVRSAFVDLPEVTKYLTEVQSDLIKNIGIFLSEGEEQATLVAQTIDTVRDERFRRYRVNVVVSHDASEGGAPIVEELNLGYGYLLGRLEYVPHMGGMTTDFLLIRPGALHRANGGYLLIDARRLLTAPFAYEALKRALKRREIRLESPNEGLAGVSAQSLDPAPIPLRAKVVLFGDREVYYALNRADPDFNGLFKIQADFDETIDVTDDNVVQYARLIRSIVDTHEIRHVDAGGVARLMERAARLADDNQRMSLQVGILADVVREADYYAGEAGRDLITEEDISKAIQEKIFRADRIRERSHESITRDVMLVDTDGAKVGQINGLSVLALPNLSFGKPTRITASVRMGNGRVTDIEREVELGGPLHSKGVMILWGYLASRFARDVPLSIAASLVFEQSYGGVDGDSASSTELYALLSALSDIPIRQSIAVTGSVNQWGEVQAIGGVNEKIEGFFDVCKERGLTGGQGVMIPKANELNLMLRQDVVAAARAGQFAIYSVETIDEGIEILTGIPAGERDRNGNFPVGTVFAAVEGTLRHYAHLRAQYAKSAGGTPDGLLG